MKCSGLSQNASTQPLNHTWTTWKGRRQRTVRDVGYGTGPFLCERISPIGGFMTLKIVWRNPSPPRKAKKLIQPIVSDEFGSSYLVTTRSGMTTYEVIPGGATRNDVGRAS